ncbi:MAG: hypothetical protein ACR2KG_00010 [Nocardioidaceae bacterium]
MDDGYPHLVIHDADEQELRDGTAGFRCRCELRSATGRSRLCMATADQRVTVLCRTCGSRTFIICPHGCLATLFESVTGIEGYVTCYCGKWAPGHEIVAVMALRSV